MSYTPPTFAALSAELRCTEEIGVVARHLIESRSEADLAELLSDGLRLHRQLADLSQALGFALQAAAGTPLPAADLPAAKDSPPCKTPLLHRATG